MQVLDEKKKSLRTHHIVNKSQVCFFLNLRKGYPDFFTFTGACCRHRDTLAGSQRVLWSTCSCFLSRPRPSCFVGLEGQWYVFWTTRVVESLLVLCFWCFSWGLKSFPRSSRAHYRLPTSIFKLLSLTITAVHGRTGKIYVDWYFFGIGICGDSVAFKKNRHILSGC